MMMRVAGSILFFYVLILQVEIYAAIQPESRFESQYVLMGEYTHLSYNGSTLKCNYSSTQKDYGSPIIKREDNSVVFTSPGQYQYECPAAADKHQEQTINSFRVVTAQHKVTVCGSSRSNCNCSKELTIMVGDVVYWSMFGVSNCSSIQLVNTSCPGRCVISNFSGHPEPTGLQEGYHFNQEGTYQLLCNGNTTETEALLIITTVDNTLTDTVSSSHKGLIYSHAGIMAATFGFLLPLGAILASYKWRIAHIVLQICGQILLVVGLIMVIIYQELNHKIHFSQLHSVVGLVIVIATIILQPTLKLLALSPLKKFAKHWHKHLGIAIVFFGLANIFMGLLVLTDTPLYIKILYGIWVAVAVAIYVFSKAFKKKKDLEYDDEDDEENKGMNSWYKKSRSDRISLSPPSSLGPSKLSREVINKGSFIQIRKKSIDVLETPFNTTNMPMNSSSSSRQRKMSNVRFGPVVAEQLSPVLDTPNHIGEGNFGFGEKSKYTDESDDSNDKGEEAIEEKEESDNEVKRDEEIEKNRQSIASLGSNEGSLRITRHSSRAHTKASEIFQRSNSFSRPNYLAPTISIDSESPLLQSPSVESTPVAEGERMDHTPSDEEFHLPKRCPFPRSANSDSMLPLHERRQRKQAMEMLLPRTDSLSIGRTTPIRSRSPSRSPSFSRKKRDLLVDNTLRSVMQMSDDAIVSANAQGEIVFWSNGAIKMFGYTPGEAIGSSLQMVIPQRYKEKHQNGINKKTDFALDYIKKHNAPPEEQKHSRLYAVHGISKSGKEFGVEVVVSSFVIDGEIYYTGIITERFEGLQRQLSATSLNSEIEIKEKQQKAMVIGTQMKIAHKLQSGDHITKTELQNILECSLKASEFEVPRDDICKMVEGILQAADPDEMGVIRFTDLIDLLAKHRLYISDSGIIARYGKSKAEGNLNLKKRLCNKISSFFNGHVSSIVWFCLYLLVSMGLLLGGLLSTDREGWSQWAFGTGPLLSYNCVLLLLPVMKGLINSMKANTFLARAIPLNQSVTFHLIFIGGVTFWAILHILTHLCSFAFDDKPNTTTTADHFASNLTSSITPFITGLLVCLVLTITAISSIPAVRKFCKFIGFYCIHWTALVIFYLLLLIHGINHYNPAFWKWLLPVLLIFGLEKLYAVFVIRRHTVKISKVFAYDETSRTLSVEIEKPKRFRFVPGQFILLNIPQIGYFNWQNCSLSSSNKEEKIKVFLPHTGSEWLKASFRHFKTNPLNPKPKDGQPELVVDPIKGYITGPHGCGTEELFNYQVAMLVCGSKGPHACRSIIQTFLEYRRSTSCHCGCHPKLAKIYFVWIIPSGNDYEWFTDFLSDIIEDKHVQRYLDIRIFLTNINSPPDELASALLHLALKTGGPALSVKRPSQPQLSKLHSNTSYGSPDFESLLDFVSMQQGTASDKDVECGVFTVGSIPYSMILNIQKYSRKCSLKRGPISNKEMEVTSPYRKQMSPDEKSPSPPNQPKDWHITFKLNHIRL